jgi:Uma2 family endonuclease
VTAAIRPSPSISADDYLRAEMASEIKHEYVGGQLHAMTGASVSHNLIMLNLAGALKAHLRGSPCQVFASDMKLRLRIGSEDVFYYPDVFVACRADERNTYYREFPHTIVEILSETTERTDRREKFLAYRTLDSLQEYILVAQDERRIVVFHRENGWQPEEAGPQGALDIPSLGFSVALDAVYEGVSV